MVTSPVMSGTQAFLKASQSVRESANKIARNDLASTAADGVAPLIELKLAEQQAIAAVRIIEVEREQVGALLDLLA